MPQQKRLLSLGHERHVERLTRSRQPHREHVQLGLHATKHREELAEVHLGLTAQQMLLRDEHLNLIKPQLDPTPLDVTRDRDLRKRRTMLTHQPLPNPPGRVTLLTRCRLIGDQPLVNHPHIRAHQPWPPRILLARRRHRASQRLPDRAPMRPMTHSQLPDRHLRIKPPITTDVLIQPHFEPGHLRPLADNKTRRSEPKVGPTFVKTRPPTHKRDHHHPTLGPKFMKKPAPSGAKICDHTQARVASGS